MKIQINYSDGRPAEIVDVVYSKLLDETYGVSVDGVSIGRIRKSTTSSPVYAGGRSYAVGSTSRTGWTAVGVRYAPQRKTRHDAIVDLLPYVRYVRPVA